MITMFELDTVVYVLVNYIDHIYMSTQRKIIVPFLLGYSEWAFI